MTNPSIETIPDDWEMRLDETTNTYYFINHATRSTQWQHPTNKLVYRPANNCTPGTSDRISKPLLNVQGPTPTKYNGGPLSQNFELNNTRNNKNVAMERDQAAFNNNDSPQRFDYEVKNNTNDQYEENNIITKVLEKAKPFIIDVNKFQGVQGNSEYLRLMENLELLILELDGVGVDGQESVRVARRAAIREIQQSIEMLEFKVSTAVEDDNKKDDGAVLNGQQQQ